MIYFSADIHYPVLVLMLNEQNKNQNQKTNILQMKWHATFDHIAFVVRRHRRRRCCHRRRQDFVTHC